MSDSEMRPASKTSDVHRLVMQHKTSEYPQDFIPAGASPIIGIDRSEHGDCTVKGFYDSKTGEFRIQEVVHNAEVSR